MREEARRREGEERGGIVNVNFIPKSASSPR
jgi:hypothetical protein